MKLNYKRTILVGFAFFLISAFWQAYDNAIPLTLTNKFGMSQTALAHAFVGKCAENGQQDHGQDIIQSHNEAGSGL